MLTLKQIHAGRAMAGITQAELASRAGISTSTVSDIESGKSDPKSSTLSSIQAALEAAGVDFNADGRGVSLRRTNDEN